jgi:hypothetical protein
MFMSDNGNLDGLIQKHLCLIFNNNSSYARFILESYDNKLTVAFSKELNSNLMSWSEIRQVEKTFNDIYFLSQKPVSYNTNCFK